VSRLVALAVLSIALGACNIAAAADEEIDTAPAMAAADAWLAMVDRGQYGASWDSAAEIFRGAIDRVKWETTIESIRAPLGVVTSRKVRLANFARTLPNAPPGEYVVIQFDTRFQNRPLATELVTPMREKDGTWRVSGYYIK
jgi:opacity protein-like surface antigen